jgi:hypothetical protein
MFTALLVTALITTVVGGVAFAAARHRGSSLEGGAEPRQLGDGTGNLLERTVRDLRVGDVIQHQGRDYLVEGTISYDEAGHRWVAGRLVDGDSELWLIVGMERAGTDTVSVAAVSSLEISGYPPETLLEGADRYNLERRGTATAKATGETDVLAGKDLSRDSVHRCRWWKYDGAGGKSLFVEQWGDSFRVLRGESISMSDLDMMPGS